MLTLFHAPKTRSSFKDYTARITGRPAFKRMMEKDGAQ